MKDCKKKQCLLSFLAVFAFMMSYEILEHSVLLAPLYKASTSVWRPVQQMDQLSTWYIVHTAMLAGLFCMLYKGFSKRTMEAGDGEAPCSYIQSINFGITIGLIMGVLASRTYTWIPMHMNIAMGWFFSGLAEGVGIGLILGLTCHKKIGSCKP